MMSFRAFAAALLSSLVFEIESAFAAPAGPVDRAHVEELLGERMALLREQLRTPHKLGMVHAARIRRDIRTIQGLLDGIHAGQAPDRAALAAVLGGSPEAAVPRSDALREQLARRAGSVDRQLRHAPSWASSSATR